MPKDEIGPGAPKPAPEDPGAAGNSTQKGGHKPGAAGKAAREERLAAALRDNLRRRKAAGKKKLDQEDRD